MTVQRFFALDSQGLRNMPELIELSKPDMVEIMPGVIGKIIKRLSDGKTPIISGGLIDSKEEVTTALSCGAVAVSTGAKDLWYI
jgi:glycerol uptake operon antiterminator